MTCDEFIAWMKIHAGRGIPENTEVTDHLRSCPACRRIFALDACLEAGIQQAFTPHRLPAGLADSIDACLDRNAGIRQESTPDITRILPSSTTMSADPGKRHQAKKG